jgi:crossover junction endodeoxyribonuclease RuvC
MKYIGLDLSLNGTGIVCLNEEGKIEGQELIKSSADKIIEERLKSINDIILELIDIYKKGNSGIVYVEGLSFGAKGNAIMQLAGLHYLIRINLCLKDGLKYDIIPPTTLKKFTTGKGNAKKELMLLEVYKRWGIEFKDNNLADAYSLARMALDNYKE